METQASTCDNPAPGWVDSGLFPSDPARETVNSLLTLWGDLVGAKLSDDRRTFVLPPGAIWPSAQVTGFLVRLLPRDQLDAQLFEAALRTRGTPGGPRALGSFYHRCYDLIRDREAAEAAAALEAVRAATFDEGGNDDNR